MKKNVVLGFLGPIVDAGTSEKRWSKWRPSVSLFQQEDFVVHRFEMLYQEKFSELAELVQKDIRDVSPESELKAHCITLHDPWDFEEVYNVLYDVVRGYSFRPDEENYFVHITTGSHVAQICMFLLTEARYIPGCLLQSQPPGKGASGPGSIITIDLDLSRYDTIMARLNRDRHQELSALKSGIETRNQKFNELIERIEFVAHESKAPLLFLGPNGAGKSRLARKVYELKKQHHQISGGFVEVNCATLRGDAAMSTLFGHVKGAYTGAERSRGGLLKEADKGLLFLDEIGELGLDEQAMLLQALEERSYLPVGADTPVQSEFLLIAATNKNLQECILAGSFRQDLFTRINMWSFELPGLQDRVEDIEPNIEYELERCSHEFGKNISFNREGREKFLQFAMSRDTSWSGNFRDLSSALRRMATLATSGRIGVHDVEEEIGRLQSTWGYHCDKSNSEDLLLNQIVSPHIYHELDTFDKLQLASVLKVCQSSKNMSDAGQRLFEVSRRKRKSVNDADRLRKYLMRYGISWSDIPQH